jgi:hypothetical protein
VAARNARPFLFRLASPGSDDRVPNEKSVFGGDFVVDALGDGICLHLALKGYAEFDDLRNEWLDKLVEVAKEEVIPFVR